jgi:predicted nucleic acid-binding protein
MANPKLRLLDSDVISNLLMMKVRSDVSICISNDSSNFDLLTTQVVIREVQIGVNKIDKTRNINGNAISDTEISEIKRTWNEIKNIFTIRKVKEDPSTLKNSGERSLVDILSTIKKENCRIVSNNGKDVFRFLKGKSLPREYHQYPFEFFEEMVKSWFEDYKDMIRFIILSNHDFKVIKKENLGNILTRIKTR